MNDMKVPNVKDSGAIGRKSKDLERRIQKGFQITKVEENVTNAFASLVATAKASFDQGATKKKDSKDVFKRIAKAAAKKEKKDWNQQVKYRLCL